MLSMANAGPNTNGSQFFITTGTNRSILSTSVLLTDQARRNLIRTVPTPHLDGKHTVSQRSLRSFSSVSNLTDLCAFASTTGLVSAKRFSPSPTPSKPLECLRILLASPLVDAPTRLIRPTQTLTSPIPLSRLQRQSHSRSFNRPTHGRSSYGW